MTHSLYAKFLLGYLVFGLLAFITIATFSSRITYNYLVREQADALYDEASLIASSYSSVYRGGSASELESAYPQLNAVSAFIDAQIWVLNRTGDIILDSNHSYRTGQAVDGFDPTAWGSHYYTISTYYSMFTKPVLSVMAPITGNFKTYGYVVLHMPLNQINDSRNSILNILYITFGIIFALSLTIILVFTKTVYFPLKKITQAAKEYASGNLTFQLQLNSEDEMGYLANTLNVMSDELNHAEEYQKKFIANVSHDFRSPLTSIKGYLEAMIDGTIPPEMQEKYLHIVINETERLNKLTQGMLTLDSLDSKGTTFLNKTNFDLNRVIKDTAATFEGTCNRRSIIIDLTFTGSTQMVYADMGKIQQVLYNLIDNAIKFSHDGSIIFISASEKYEKIFVSVKDTGVGIPKGSIKKIWERFYKSDTSRGKDKKGTGLGLAIVKEIIQAHGENIDVISTEGVGTEFIFSLPRSIS